MLASFSDSFLKYSNCYHYFAWNVKNKTIMPFIPNVKIYLLHLIYITGIYDHPKILSMCYALQSSFKSPSSYFSTASILRILFSEFMWGI